MSIGLIACSLGMIGIALSPTMPFRWRFILVFANVLTIVYSLATIHGLL
jgi:hypothetical protein